LASIDLRRGSSPVPRPVAGADNSAGFSDPVGDAASGPDIPAGRHLQRRVRLHVFVTVAGGNICAEFGSLAGPIVAIDRDQNPDTGSGYYGTEVALTTDYEGITQLLRAQGWDFKRAPRVPGLGSECGPTGFGFYVAPAEIGLSETGGFSVVVGFGGPDTDTAPDIRMFNYQQVPGTPPGILGPDRRAPHVTAFPARATRCRAAKLGYWSLDGRGRTRQIVRIFQGRRLLKTIWTPLADANPFRTSELRWQVPRNVHGRLRYSVRSLDAAGNKSNRALAPLLVR
jgi:hypothetical protein